MKRIIPILALLVLPLSLLAQSTFLVSNKSTIKIEGTSSLHDWSMQTQALQGDAEMILTAGKLQDVKALKLVIAAESLKSGKSAMDKNAYEALKTEKFPSIQFKLGNLNSIEQKGDDLLITASGVLTIAGFSRPERIEVQGKVDSKGILYLSGKKSIKMSQYGIEPPSFMFGSVTTGDALNVTFNLMLTPESMLQ